MTPLVFSHSSVQGRGGAALAFLSFAVVCGCTTDPSDRPPSQSSDVPTLILPGHEGGAAGQEQPEAPSDEVTGKFNVYSDDLFLAVAPYTERSSLLVLGEDRTSEDTFPYDGVHFSTDALRRAEQVWILVRPNTDDGVFPTWSAENTTEPELAFALFPKVLLSDILASLATPLDLNPEASQVLLRTVDAVGRPLAGVRVQGALAGSALYTVAGTWADWSNETDDSGLILLYNLLVTDKLPGVWLRVEVAHNGQQSLEIPALAGTVTEAIIDFD